ncbi:uncharacterized protein DS421_4g125690 [Arachis hypogaea]|nr:uncharacterized protein DS421_4g125690 [Arachis hypogaea]
MHERGGEGQGCPAMHCCRSWSRLKPLSLLGLAAGSITVTVAIAEAPVIIDWKTPLLTG